jgi:hypothetical protein
MRTRLGLMDAIKKKGKKGMIKTQNKQTKN